MTTLIPARRHPCSISLGFCLFLMLVFSLPLGLIANWRNEILREQGPGRRLRELGGVTESVYGLQPYKLRFVLPEDCRYPIGSYYSIMHSKEHGVVGNSPVTNEVMRQLPKLPHLRVLCLNGKRQPGVDFAPCSQLAQLERLTLDCEATDDDVLCFRSQQHLDTLHLNKQLITNACLVVAESNPKLTRIGLTDTAITDEGLRKLGKLTKLEWLFLERTKITSAGLKHLHGLQELYSLDLEGTAVDDTAIADLAKLGPIQHITLRGTRFTPAGVEKLKSLLPQCNVAF